MQSAKNGTFAYGVRYSHVNFGTQPNEHEPIMSQPAKSLPELLSFLDSQPEPRIVMDADYRIVAANRAYVREFSQGRPVRGRHCYEVSHRFTVPCDQAGESCPLRISQEGGTSHQVLHLHHTSRGEEHVVVETNPIRDDQGAIVYFVETLRLSSTPLARQRRKVWSAALRRSTACSGYSCALPLRRHLFWCSAKPAPARSWWRA